MVKNYLITYHMAINEFMDCENYTDFVIDCVIVNENPTEDVIKFVRKTYSNVNFVAHLNMVIKEDYDEYKKYNDDCCIIL